MKLRRKLAHPLNQQGQALTEYITLLVLIALVGVGAAQSIGKLVRGKMMTARKHIKDDIHFNNVRSPSDSESDAE